jgi:hypothetical protein
MGLPGGLWCYVLPLLDSAGPSAYESQCISDFVQYERRHNRVVGLWIQHKKAVAHVCESACASSPPEPDRRILPSACNSVCCRTHHPEGCDGEYVCHAAPLEAATAILECGRILSKHRLTGLPLDQLAKEGTWGDPPDYFGYVNLARGGCVAPDIVAMSRQRRRNLSPAEVDDRFYPGVRFIFQTVELMRHPDAEWDGIHPIKIRDSIDLDEIPFTVVSPEQTSDGGTVSLGIPARMRAKMIRIDHRQFPSLATWSSAVLRALRAGGPG